MTPMPISTSHTDTAAAGARRRWRWLKLLGWGFVASAPLSACADAVSDPTPTTAERVPLGRADADSGTCEARCGGMSDGICWCDTECERMGDCCSDYVTFCAVMDDRPALCEATGGAWVAGACDCEQDGASMGYVFDVGEGCRAPDAEPSVLCESTGGAWVDGACDCQQDGASMNMNYQFDPVTGCGPGPVDPGEAEALCTETGGVWEAGACECAQDGASLYFVFQPEIGCAFPDDTPLQNTALNLGAQAFLTNFAPAAGDGVYLIDRPGVADMITFYKSWDDAVAYLGQYDWPATLADAGVCQDGLQTEAMPTVDCEADGGMSPAGCHFISVLGIETLHGTMETLNEYGFAEYTEAEISAARIAGETVFRLYTHSVHGVTFGFTFKDGAWRIVLIDLSRFSCSA